ncbi:MAG TPA: aspartyl protease family protein [Rhizomicrobium sp.]|nr:aspartyl protease family protein [Rhizomicrobium sp.]
MAKFFGAALAFTIVCSAAFADMTGDTREADQEFFAGRFEHAQKLYEAVEPSSPAYETALRQLGAIALYENRLDDAARLLQLALDKAPQDLKVDLLLAETASRRNDFPAAAKWLRQAGRPDRALAYEVFPDTPPYSVTPPAKRARVPFIETDPLPLVEARVNGKPGLFLIDTGAAEIVLDPDFANGAGIETVSGGTGTFAGGRTAPITYARILKFSLGRLDVASVPAILVSTQGFSGAAGGRPVAGVIGTSFLSRFRSTIDYPGSALILEPRDAAPFASPVVAEIPFVLVRDHFLLARGALDAGPEQMFFVDTGLAGSAFTAPASTFAAAGIALPAAQNTPLPNAIGQSAAVPIDIRSLSLGTLTRENLSALYGPFPPSLESSTGVHIGGIVSHAFFRPYAITFDFARMKLVVRKPQA